ncbi:MAG TPA: class I SAM-dependent methyltransferase [Candidatus Limnocylindrales bacterium]|nr:class I SAM-dependent methyltransferase [Candidatus Limnocylindrales bacterium]
MSTMPYDPDAYWRTLHERDDLSAVGQSALPVALNAWLYRALAGNVRRFVRRHRLDQPPPSRAFDVGSGTGFWVGFWHARGVWQVDGCDLVAAAVERLSARFGPRGDRFTLADIVDGRGLPAEPYPLVSVMNVLLHITVDDAFDRALANVARLVAPGGHLLLVEPILRDHSYARPATTDQHSRARPLAAYRDPLVAAGLELVDLAPAVALANNPIEAGSRAAYVRYARWWRWVAAQAKRGPRRAAAIGALVAAADRVAMATGVAPSSKIALFRRPSA